MKKKISFRDKMICVLFACLLLGILELFSRAVFRPENELDAILEVIEQDPVLFWRPRPDLDTVFHDVNIRTNDLGLRSGGPEQGKQGNVLRIVCLGASPTFGWGVKEGEAYPAQIQKTMTQKYGRSAEVINAGVIGYTSFQGEILFKEKILSLEPDIITISYVVNDVDKYRFYRNDGRSDKDVGPKNRALVLVENILGRSRLLALLKRYILRAGESDPRFYGKAPPEYPEGRRVMPADYKANLEEIIDMAGSRGIKVVLIKMPLAAPFEAKKVTDTQKKEAGRHIANSLTYAEDGMYNEANKEAEMALEKDPYMAEACYYLGVYHRAGGDRTGAEEYFRRAKELELAECAVLSVEYNKIMQDLAYERNIPVVDVPGTFDVFPEEDRRDIYVDPGHDFVHPNATGHKIIGDTVAETIDRDLLPERKGVE